jgi:hypothetical protein
VINSTVMPVTRGFLWILRGPSRAGTRKLDVSRSRRCPALPARTIEPPNAIVLCQVVLRQDFDSGINQNIGTE